ncbi:MAG: Na+/H+ antiporter subunit E, partial [Bosea sp.]|nr:Na+/H+ antiporter subunit E [Bosea sp. (in: a-proteobacteria)]
MTRGAGFLALWLVLMGPAMKDLPVGVVAAAAAAWTSTVLWPARGSLSFPGVLRFLVRFLPQAVAAGIDVARRAFALVPPLQPGFVT